MFRMKNWRSVTCKNCGDIMKSRIMGVDLCSAKCIKEWIDEVKAANKELKKN